MSLFELLQNNKGTVSSALGKELADKVLKGNTEILPEALQYVNYDLPNEKSKNIRAGAAKIIQLVAEKCPEMVSPYLDEILTSLSAPEPQTRWMSIMTLGYCAKHNPVTAFKGIPYARDFIREHQGVCLSSAAERYLGSIGELSAENSEIVFPILLEAYDNPLLNEVDWIFEAFIKIIMNLTQKNKDIVSELANEHLNSSTPATEKRAQKIIKIYKK